MCHNLTKILEFRLRRINLRSFAASLPSMNQNEQNRQEHQRQLHSGAEWSALVFLRSLQLRYDEIYVLARCLYTYGFIKHNKRASFHFLITHLTRDEVRFFLQNCWGETFLEQKAANQSHDYHCHFIKPIEKIFLKLVCNLNVCLK